MASGLPDYFRVIRPSYGAAKSVKALVAAKTNDRQTIISVVGKGMIYGGFLYTDLAVYQKDGIPILVVDDVDISWADFEIMNERGFVKVRGAPFSLLKYDTVNRNYSVTLASGFTFERMFAIVYHERNGKTLNVVARVAYALIGSPL